jgi:hypothetical protein
LVLLPLFVRAKVGLSVRLSLYFCLSVYLLVILPFLYLSSLPPSSALFPLHNTDNWHNRERSFQEFWHHSKPCLLFTWLLSSRWSVCLSVCRSLCLSVCCAVCLSVLSVFLFIIISCFPLCLFCSFSF